MDFLDDTPDRVAPRLLGCELLREIDGHTVCVKIVETEAYDEADAASHSYRGKTKRTSVMFGSSGHLYVYFTYGMHYCCNIVTSKKGRGAAVLIRAVEPIKGEDYVLKSHNRYGYELTNGPAKLCQALGIDNNLNGHDLTQLPLKLIVRPPLNRRLITQSTRIGITKAKEKLLRFYVTGNPYVSHAK